MSVARVEPKSNEELRELITFGGEEIAKKYENVLKCFDEESFLQLLYTHGGIPRMELRRKYWKIILSCDEVKEEEGLYKKLVEKDVDRNLGYIIDCDILRLGMPYCFYEEEGEGRKALTRILRAYSVYDRNLGYCQGMHSVAALFLIHHCGDEETSFWRFASLMKHPKFDFKSLYSRDLIKLKALMKCLERLADVECPKITKFLKSYHLNISVFCCSSFGSVFTNYLFQTTTLMWDIFFLKGWEFFLKLQTAIIKQQEEKLIGGGIKSSSEMMKMFSNSVFPKDVYQLFKSADDVSDEQLRKWEIEEGQIMLEKELSDKNNPTVRRSRKKNSDKFSHGRLDNLVESYSQENPKMMNNTSYEEDIQSDLQDQIQTPDVEKMFMRFGDIIEEQQKKKTTKRRRFKKRVKFDVTKKKENTGDDNDDEEFLKTPIGFKKSYGDITDLNEFLGSVETPATAAPNKGKISEDIFQFDFE